MKYPIWAVDFDGCIHDSPLWPIIGEPIPKAKELMIRHKACGGYIIINSCRTGIYEEAARKWLIDHSMPFDAINENLDFQIAKYGCDCRKICADLYIDDRNPGGANWELVERIAFDEEL